MSVGGSGVVGMMEEVDDILFNCGSKMDLTELCKTSIFKKKSCDRFDAMQWIEH